METLGFQRIYLAFYSALVQGKKVKGLNVLNVSRTNSRVVYI